MRISEYPRWDNTGSEPPGEKKSEGWQPGEKPPADFFNWFFASVYNSFIEVDGGIAQRVSDILSNGITSGGEVMQNVPDLSVLVENTEGYIDGYRVILDSLETVDLSAHVPGSDSRWVSLYLALDDGDITFETVEGTTAEEPEKPSVQGGSKFLLADILLESGQTEILDEDIDASRAQIATPGEMDIDAEAVRTDSDLALTVETRTDDPSSPATGRLWMRTDL